MTSPLNAGHLQVQGSSLPSIHKPDEWPPKGERLPVRDSPFLLVHTLPHHPLARSGGAQRESGACGCWADFQENKTIQQIER